MGSPEWAGRVESFTSAVLEKLGIDRWELSILFCDDPFIAELNSTYRRIEGPTDILSFEQGDEYIDDEGNTWFSAGDLVISVHTLAENAMEFGVTEDEELKRLIIHGILHLKGLDHSDNSPEQEMLVLQEQLLASLSGLPPVIAK
ncbi:MAG: rRNA maturation RNase YbeY [Spirochaetaceae bacterium]|jgi:probable rRNA maturation factor|nr:rRNA maturation RNase YbeY [Spirochaetaceae bacterium]